MGRRGLLLLPLAFAVVAMGCVAPHGGYGYGPSRYYEPGYGPSRYYDPGYVGSRRYAPVRPVVVRPRPVVVRSRPVVVRPAPVVVRPPAYRAVKPPRRDVRREWVRDHRHERPGHGGRRTGQDPRDPRRRR
jgi:hypothetical protein